MHQNLIDLEKIPRARNRLQRGFSMAVSRGHTQERSRGLSLSVILLRSYVPEPIQEHLHGRRSPTNHETMGLPRTPYSRLERRIG